MAKVPRVRTADGERRRDGMRIRHAKNGRRPYGYFSKTPVLSVAPKKKEKNVVCKSNRCLRAVAKRRIPIYTDRTSMMAGARLTG